MTSLKYNLLLLQRAQQADCTQRYPQDTTVHLNTVHTETIVTLNTNPASLVDIDTTIEHNGFKRKSKGLVDTGAAISLIDEHTYQSLPQDIRANTQRLTQKMRVIQAQHAVDDPIIDIFVTICNHSHIQNRLKVLHSV